jgi:glucosylglycerate synthase
MSGSGMEVESVATQDPQKTEKVDRADLVVGILSDLSADAAGQVRTALRTLPGAPRIVIMTAKGVENPAPRESDTAEKSSVSVISWPPLSADRISGPVQSISAAYHLAFSVSEQMGARACCVVATQVQSDPQQWVSQFTQPLLESQFDLVVPSYGQQKFQGLLNSSIISPLMRSLYGRRIQNPLGPDLGVSQSLFQKILALSRTARNEVVNSHPLASLTSTAACENLRIGQVYVGPRVYPPADWTNVSSILVQALGPVFLEMERRAACWQRTRSSASVPSVGRAAPRSTEDAPPDISHMIESFQLGVRDLQEIWGLVLPPATLLELRKLSRLAAEQFRMADELWARIVYDFALAHRLRTINRDHLLRSMAPLYLAWVASYAIELKSAAGAAVDQRLERLALAYEAVRPYLVSRWRWPDRFNP